MHDPVLYRSIIPGTSSLNKLEENPMGKPVKIQGCIQRSAPKNKLAGLTDLCLIACCRAAFVRLLIYCPLCKTVKN